MFWTQTVLHGRSVAVFWLSNVQKMTIKTCTRQLTRMMDLMPFDFTVVNSTLPVRATISSQQNFARHDERFNVTSQPTSRTAKSGKFALLSRAIKHSDIHLEVLFLQSRKSFEYFFCFHRTLGIFPKYLEGFKADSAFIYTTLACSLAIFTNFELWLDFCKAIFQCFVRYQMRVLIG